MLFHICLALLVLWLIIQLWDVLVMFIMLAFYLAIAAGALCFGTWAFYAFMH